MPRYLVLFAQVHSSFRIPELDSISTLYNFKYSFPDADHSDPERPFMIIDLAEDDHAKLLSERCILIKTIYELYSFGPDWPTVHQRNLESKPLWEKYIPSTSFKFVVEGFNHSISQSKQRATIESLSYMDFKGEITLKNPEIVLCVWEEWNSYPNAPSTLRDIYLGRKLYESTARPLIKKFDVKKRAYYGNTSMESEVSLLMANQTLAAPGKLMYDPFTGTGSMIYPAAHFGATFFGSDIDGRQMRGKDSSSIGIHRALKQYDSPSTALLDLATFDITWNPWRTGELFDAIVCDPPYGVRAGAKTLGRKREMNAEHLAKYHAYRANHDAPYIPPTKPYELSTLVKDLVLFARWLLKADGRLVFFLPTVNEDYQEIDIRDMLCDNMELVANSLQDFGSWGRRLITIRKVAQPEGEPPFPRPVFSTVLSKQETVDGDTHVPAHRDFREKYFKGFKKDGEESAQV